MKQLIINADDLGISKGTNQAIAKSYNEGILTSASLMANMPAFDDAIENVIPKNPGLGIGVHLSLTIGKSVLDRSKVALLVDKYGYFNNSFLKILLMIKKKADIKNQIYHELKAQFDRIVNSGIDIDHVDSQHHIHLIPEIFDIVIALAEMYHCKRIRLPDEAFSVGYQNFRLSYYKSSILTLNVIKKIVLSKLAQTNRSKLKNIKFADYFFGILNSSAMNSENLTYLLKFLKHGVTEIVTHPGFYSPSESEEKRSNLLERFLSSKNRQIEFEALVDKSIQRVINENNIHLIRFSDI